MKTFENIVLFLVAAIGFAEMWYGVSSDPLFVTIMAPLSAYFTVKVYSAITGAK